MTTTTTTPTRSPNQDEEDLQVKPSPDKNVTDVNKLYAYDDDGKTDNENDL